MIRLTVEQLYLLEESIRGSGQSNTSILPLEAMGSHRLIIAWAKTRTGNGLYLSIWKDSKSWADAIAKDNAGEPLPYDFANDAQTQEYTHAYPVVINNANTVDQDYIERQVRRLVRGEIETVSPSGADSGHPEYGVTHGE